MKTSPPHAIQSPMGAGVRPAVWLTLTNLAALNDESNTGIVAEAVGRKFVPIIMSLSALDGFKQWALSLV
jgi:hypothetical protein